MTALPDRAAPCRAAKRPMDVLLLCAALALCGEAIEPRLDIGNPKVIKPEPTDARLDVVLHMALVCRVRERGQIRSNRVLKPPMEELPNRWHLGNNRPACSSPRELHPLAMDDLPRSSVHVLALTLP